MEIGNMLFGNARGEHHIPRFVGYEEELWRLFEAYAGKDWNRQGYSPEFENAIFEVFPYWWGDCECGFEEREGKWDAENGHTLGCYQTKLWRGIRGMTYGSREREQIVEELCAQMELPYPTGSLAHCTCDYEARYAEWLAEDGGHDAQCGVVKPNFLYKPTGFSISWYKYPLRDSYMSERLTVQELGKLIDNCIASLEG